jgi:hypothetical protein
MGNYDGKRLAPGPATKVSKSYHKIAHSNGDSKTDAFVDYFLGTVCKATASAACAACPSSYPQGSTHKIRVTIYAQHA